MEKVLTSSYSNFTKNENHSDVFDPFCSEFLDVHIIWGLASVPCIIIGVPASGWLLWLLIERKRSSSTGNDVYILNLTFMDANFNISVLLCVFNLLWWHSNTVYRAVSFLFSFNALGRPLFMAAMCVDCYFAVGYPVLYMRMRQSLRRLVVCVLIWIGTLALAAVLCFQTSYISLGFSAVPNAFSLPVIITCDIAIICALKKADFAGKCRADIDPQKKRALQTITSSLVLVLLCCVPPIVVFVLSPLIDLNPKEMFCQVAVPTYIAPTLASVVMPMIQLHTRGKLRDLKEFICVSFH